MGRVVQMLCFTTEINLDADFVLGCKTGLKLKLISI